ncbi:MAG TPA: intradiol ring-cleavage dioxygenase [Puia sp.]|nr:intradiol ring-cleavage dioxygenase [Puia sp.]
MKQSRKKFITHLLIGVSSAPLLIEACQKENSRTSATTVSGSDSTESVSGTCYTSPEETAGPYPFDLSSNSAMFRSDITEGKEGIPLTLILTIVNSNNNCTVIPNARVDIWHCDKDGYYSEYNEPGYLGQENNTGKTFLRGIQIADSNGQVKFITIYPGWYQGRATHIHVEVFVSSVLKKTTQLAFPDKLNQEVYTTSLYAGHGQNTSVADNEADGIFADSLSEELLTLSGDTSNGFSANFQIGVAS